MTSALPREKGCWDSLILAAVFGRCGIAWKLRVVFGGRGKDEQENVIGVVDHCYWGKIIGRVVRCRVESGSKGYSTCCNGGEAVSRRHVACFFVVKEESNAAVLVVLRYEAV